MTIRKNNRIVLPKGQRFYHGTNSLFNFTMPKRFSWFSTAEGQAGAASLWFNYHHGEKGRIGIDRVLVFEATRPVILFGARFDTFHRLAKKQGYKKTKNHSNISISPYVCKGLREQADGTAQSKKTSHTMLCDPSKVLRYVSMYRVRRDSLYGGRGRMFGPLYDPTRSGR